MNRIALFLILIAMTRVEAVVLPEMPPAPPISVVVDPDPFIPCDQIVERVLKFSTASRNYHDAVYNFVLESSDRILSWHGILKPLEGTSQTLPPNTFAPLERGGNEIANLAGMTYENAEVLNGELDNIIRSLSECTIRERQ